MITTTLKEITKVVNICMRFEETTNRQNQKDHSTETWIGQFHEMFKLAINPKDEARDHQKQ